MVMTIADVLNRLDYMGFFSYVLPFLLIFAVVYAILKKAKILGENEHSINIIVAVSVGLLSLQFDMVPTFFANIFPKTAVFLSVVLVILIFLGFVGVSPTGNKAVVAIGAVAAIFVVLWAYSDFVFFGGFGGANFMFWVGEYFWSVIILLVVAGAIVAVGKSG